MIIDITLYYLLFNTVKMTKLKLNAVRMEPISKKPIRICYYLRNYNLIKLQKKNNTIHYKTITCLVVQKNSNGSNRQYYKYYNIIIILMSFKWIQW